MTLPAAPIWSTTQWFNTPQPLTLAALKGRVVMLHAFQMLCPGCVSHGIPQAQRVASLFVDAPLTVVGLHTVFEHHDVMGPSALEVFLHEYRVQFPVGVDQPGQAGNPRPRTMEAYGMRGTPTVILIDAHGRVRYHAFGAYDDLSLGRDLGTLIAEVSSERPQAAAAGSSSSKSVQEPHCDEVGCVIDEQ